MTKVTPYLLKSPMTIVIGKYIFWHHYNLTPPIDNILQKRNDDIIRCTAEMFSSPMLQI